MSRVCSAAGSAAPSLGPLTNSATPIDPERYRLARRRRYEAQATAAALLPGERVSRCGWRPIEGHIGISCRDGRHFVSNVRVCGSVWTCPNCASKVATRRADELNAAVNSWTDQGGSVWLLTLTIDHVRKNTLEDLVKRFTEAMRKLWAGKWSASWRSDSGQVGIVRNIEVTWGATNGWHPHCHALLFVGSDEVSCFESRIKERWQSVAARFGFSVSLKRGATLDLVTDGRVVSDYVNKDETATWGAAHELTWANIKTARGQRFTPFALLAACDLSEVSAAPALFQEYADAFKGRRQLYWSKGLRDLLQLDIELSDQDVAQARDDQAEFVAAVDTSIFCWIKARGFLPDLLDNADDFGLNGINAFLGWAYERRAIAAGQTHPRLSGVWSEGSGERSEHLDRQRTPAVFAYT